MSDKKLHMPRKAIKRYLSERGIAQKDFAASIGETGPKFSNYMKGLEPSEKTLKAIYERHPDIARLAREEEYVLDGEPVYYIEKTAMDYIIRYGQNNIVLKSNLQDAPAVKITYSKVEYFNN